MATMVDSFCKALWKRKTESGAELVEYVILIIPFIFVFSLIMSFSQVLYAGQVALNAASSGARVAIVQEDENKARSVASEAVSAYMQNVGMGIKYEGDISLEVPNSWKREEICTCVVKVKVHTIMPMPVNVFGGISSEIEVTRGIPMMIERGV